MIDLHAHVLPGVDDGPESLAEAVAMCRLAWQTGCTTMVATPHRRRDQWPDLPRVELLARLDELRLAIDVPLSLELGAEVRVDSELLRELLATPEDEPSTLAESNVLLLELEPRCVGPDPVELVRELVDLGYQPLVAHPELTPCLRHDLPLAGALVDAGARLQATAMSLTGEFGRGPRAAVAEMLDAGLVHVVASDAHRHDWRPPGLARARNELARQWGEPVAQALTEENARALLARTRLARTRSEASA